LDKSQNYWTGAFLPHSQYGLTIMHAEKVTSPDALAATQSNFVSVSIAVTIIMPNRNHCYECMPIQILGNVSPIPHGSTVVNV